jgi:hypothetical protein
LVTKSLPENSLPASVILRPEWAPCMTRHTPAGLLLTSTDLDWSESNWYKIIHACFNGSLAHLIVHVGLDYLWHWASMTIMNSGPQLILILISSLLTTPAPPYNNHPRISTALPCKQKDHQIQNALHSRVTMHGGSGRPQHAS